MNIVVFGLSLSSSWGNGHAVTYRSLIKGLHALGHQVYFFERNVPWYEEHRDFKIWPFSSVYFYEHLSDLAGHRHLLRDADFVLIGSYVPDAAILFRIMRELRHGLIGLYDIDTPVTLSDLREGRPNVFDRTMITDCDLYFSFTGGTTLKTLRDEFGTRYVFPLYCSVDPDLHYQKPHPHRYALSYLGTYSPDRQPSLNQFLAQTALRLPSSKFIVAGALFPDTLLWPKNVQYEKHIGPEMHPAFYGQSRATLNITRADMLETGYSPSIRLFEAASCGTTILTDDWAGLSTFFEPEKECIVVRETDDVIAALQRSQEELKHIAEAARSKTLAFHSGRVRAKEFVYAIESVRAGHAKSSILANNIEPFV